MPDRTKIKARKPVAANVSIFILIYPKILRAYVILKGEEHRQ